MSHNLANLPVSEQRAIQRDLKAAKWAHDIARGKLTKLAVYERINALPSERQQRDMKDRLTKFLNQHHDHAAPLARGFRPRTAGKQAHAN